MGEKSGAIKLERIAGVPFRDVSMMKWGQYRFRAVHFGRSFRSFMRVSRTA